MFRVILQVEEAIDEVLTQDEDMNAMYLTDKLNNIPRAIHDHEDLELLLESFSKQVEEIVNEAENIEVIFVQYQPSTSNDWPSALGKRAIDAGDRGINPGF